MQSDGANLDAADWVGAWAPGGGERVMAEDIGIPLGAGSRLVAQVHYNLIAGGGPDRSTVRLRLSPAREGDRKALDTMLLPAPVELPCRDNRTAGMCSRAVSVAEVRQRFLLLAEELRVAAWIGLGRVKDPQSGATEPNLNLARHAIDTLGMLEVKTRGNRDEVEERALRQMLADLRISFVEVTKARAATPGGGESGEAGEGVVGDPASTAESQP